MTSRHRSRFRIALLALCTLLLAQWTLATHACPVIAQAGEAILLAQAETAQAGEAGQQHTAATDCHAAATAADTHHAPSESPTCLKHCADDGSVSGSAGLAFAAAGAPPMVVRSAPAPAPGPISWWQAPVRGAATAPPLSILYCVFLI
jgi:hypothetical protein